MRVVIIGANGQLGSDLTRVLRQQAKHGVVALTHADVEVTDMRSVAQMMDTHHPDLVINTAAFHKVDLCEEQIEQAFAVNVYGVYHLALACHEYNAALVHISTDYVFGGDAARRAPYTESDRPAPITVYGTSKLAGENLLSFLLERCFLVRTAGLYGVAGSREKRGNFVELMLRLAATGRDIRVVDDQRTTPTYTVDLASQIAALIDTGAYGLYHATSQGSCTWYEFATEIFRLSGLSPNLGRARTGDFGEKATRPAYSVLDNKHLRDLGLDLMRPWQEALAAYLQERDLAPQDAPTSIRRHV